MVTTVNGAAGTIQVKLGGGVLRDIRGIAAGTSYTFQAKDGPDVNGNYKILIGAAAVPVVNNQSWVNPAEPLTFVNGLAFTVGGTPGEFFVQWD